MNMACVFLSHVYPVQQLGRIWPYINKIIAIKLGMLRHVVFNLIWSNAIKASLVQCPVLILNQLAMIYTTQMKVGQSNL